MENVKQFIQKFLDTYLLPAVASTFMGIIYFSYKCDGTNSSRLKPLTIFKRIFPLKNVAKKAEDKTNRLTEMYSLVPQATEELTTVVVHIQRENRNKPLTTNPSQEMVGMKKSHAFKVKSNPEVDDKSAYSVPESFCDRLDKSKTWEEIEPIWDYYDVISPLELEVHEANDQESRRLIGECSFTGDFTHLKEEDIPSKLRDELKEDMLESYSFDDELWFPANEAVDMKVYGKNYWQFVFE